MCSKSVIILVAVLALFGTVHGDQNVVDVEVKNSTTFTLDLYKAFFNSQENSVISPLSFRIVLSILYQCASGNSESELQTDLHLSDKVDTLKSHRKSLEEFGKSPNIKLVNKIYLNDNSVLNKDFSEAVTQYNSAVETINFSAKVETTAKINQWIEEQTNHQIKDLITKEVFDDDIAVLILNTIYFKAKWADPFTPGGVERPFTDINGITNNIQFMSNSGDFYVGNVKDLDSKVLSLPYEDSSNFVFWIILPNTESNIGEVLPKLSFESFKVINDSFKLSNYQVTIPMYEIESAIDGEGILKKIGIQSIFEKPEIHMLESGIRSKVDEIKQKTKIIVNTDGTEAVSATYLKAVKLSLPPSFTADRPFIYAILTADKLEPVFMGHFSKSA